VLVAQTERRNQAVDGLPNGVTAASQGAIVPCRLERQGDATRVKYLTLRQRSVDLPGDHIVPNALKHFAEDDVGQPEALAIEFRIQPVGFGIAQACSPSSGSA
jgi:hypothetical protein